MKKKICIVTTISLTVRSFLLDTISVLDENGFDVTVICSEDLNLPKLLPENVKYIPIQMQRGINIKNSVECMYKMYKVFVNEKFDLVQYSTPNAALYASIASYISRIPVRLYCQWGIAYVAFSGIKRQILKSIEKLVCLLSTRIEPDSFGNLHFAQKEGLYKNKGKVVWNGSAAGVDLDKFSYDQKITWRNNTRKNLLIDDDVVFGFVGRLNRDKGVNELLSAYRLLQEQFENVKLLVIGSSEKVYELNQEVYLWSQNSSSVIYVEHVSDIEKYYAAIDVLVLPSYREGFGSVVIEAGAMEIPSIITNIPGPTDAVIDGLTGLVVDVKDVNSLYQGMEKLLVNKNLRCTLGEKARAFANERFEKKMLLNHILQDRFFLVSSKGEYE